MSTPADPTPLTKEELAEAGQIAKQITKAGFGPAWAMGRGRHAMALRYKREYHTLEQARAILAIIQGRGSASKEETEAAITAYQQARR